PRDAQRRTRRHRGGAMTAPTPSRPEPAYSQRRLVPGREALLISALVFGLLMLGIQLWLLTVALELYLAGDGDHVWGIAVGSGLLFLGGLFAVWRLSRNTRIGG